MNIETVLTALAGFGTGIIIPIVRHFISKDDKTFEKKKADEVRLWERITTLEQRVTDQEKEIGSLNERYNQDLLKIREENLNLKQAKMTLEIQLKDILHREWFPERERARYQ